MIVKNGIRMFTFRELMRILHVSQRRLTKAMDQHILIPTDIEPHKGRAGFRYLFSEEEINRYANRIGISADFEEEASHERKVLEARREIRKVVDPVGQIADGTLITADNVKEVFDKIQAQAEPMHIVQKEPEYEPLDYYLVKVGKAYATPEVNLPTLLTEISTRAMMDRDTAIEIQRIYGGHVIQLYTRGSQNDKS